MKTDFVFSLRSKTKVRAPRAYGGSQSPNSGSDRRKGTGTGVRVYRRGPGPWPGAAGVRDHLDRAGDSILLNLSEGNGKPPGSRDRIRYLRTSRGSAGESASGWDILRIRGFAPASACDHAKALLARIAAMLHGLGA